MAFPFLQRGNLADHARQLALSSYQPAIALEGLITGVDNLRHDVLLSPRFVEVARSHIGKLIAKYGTVEDLTVAEAPLFAAPPSIMRPQDKLAAPRPADAAEFKRMQAELHIASLNRAKAEGNINIDLLARLAVLKFQKTELIAQFNQVLEKCRAKLKSYEGPRQAQPAKAMEMRDRFAKFQISKKAVLRRVGQDLFETLREIEKESLGKMRRSLFGDTCAAMYELFLNRLLFTEDGRDDYLNAEHYVMLGNFERDPDRFQTMREIAVNFVGALGMNAEGDDKTVDGLLCASENAQELVAGGAPDEATPRGKAQKAILTAWVEALERNNVMEHVIASYETVSLLPQYSPPINAQQLKNALISRTERQRVEGLLMDHGRINPANLNAAVKRMSGYRGNDRAKAAGRFIGDFIRYHRDLRRMEAVVSAMDSVNVIANEKLKELSAINNTLYEYLLPEEQKPTEDKVVHHIILKADIRESTTLTRTLVSRGLNPASYFSLNFYEPINKLLPKYGATKVFIEGDAVILAMFEREGEPGFGVARTCVLAREMIEIVRAYNEQSQKAGLPSLELGIGICYDDSAPLYLMDGSTRIMISKALNESDRLSSCTKGARKYLADRPTLFNVYSFKTVEDADTGGIPDEFLMRYNIGGIHINQAAFHKLSQEILLQSHELEMPTIWGKETVRLYSGMVPLGSGLFHRILVREGKIAHIDASAFTLKSWTERCYYEVCTSQVVYEMVDKAATRSVGAAQ